MIKKVLSSQEKFKDFYSLDFKAYSIKIDEDSYDSILHCYEEILKFITMKHLLWFSTKKKMQKKKI
jgi:hypothetical protein